MKSKGAGLTVLLIYCCQLLRGQSFEIPIYFEDAIGNRDTIILGYDSLATYGIDDAFGEIDIIDSSYSQIFEVRAAIYEYDFNYGEHPRIHESKQMFVPPVCFDPYFSGKGHSIMAVIKCEHWPITLRWDQSLFIEQCNQLDIINCTPGGWFDVCGGDPLLVEMHLGDVATYSYTDFQYVGESDTLSTLFFRFFNSFDTGIFDELSEGKISFYPNPTKGILHFNSPWSKDDKFSITDISGRSIPFKYSNQGIDLSQASDGLYILTVQLHRGGLFSTKIIKRSNL